MDNRDPVISVRIPRDHLDRLESIAGRLGVTRSHLIRRAVANHLSDAADLADVMENPVLRDIFAMFVKSEPANRQEVFNSIFDHVRSHEAAQRQGRFA
jgi:predicted DNA-binding protein